MSARLHDDKGLECILFGIERQDTLDLGVHFLLGRGKDAKIDNSRTAALDENDTAKIPVAGNEDPPLFTGKTEHFGVCSLDKVDLGSRQDIMPQALEESDGACVDVLVS